MEGHLGSAFDREPVTYHVHGDGHGSSPSLNSDVTRRAGHIRTDDGVQAVSVNEKRC